MRVFGPIRQLLGLVCRSDVESGSVVGAMVFVHDCCPDLTPIQTPLAADSLQTLEGGSPTILGKGQPFNFRRLFGWERRMDVSEPAAIGRS
jgi:hypothetical protein